MKLIYKELYNVFIKNYLIKYIMNCMMNYVNFVNEMFNQFQKSIDELCIKLGDVLVQIMWHIKISSRNCLNVWEFLQIIQRRDFLISFNCNINFLLCSEMKYFVHLLEMKLLFGGEILIV